MNGVAAAGMGYSLQVLAQKDQGSGLVLTEGSWWPEYQRRAVGDEDRRRRWVELEDGVDAGCFQAPGSIEEMRGHAAEV